MNFLASLYKGFDQQGLGEKAKSLLAQIYKTQEVIESHHAPILKVHHT